MSAEPASIVTLTMNPALDLSTSTDRVVSEHKMRCGPTRIDPGGGGVNVSRVVRELGGESIAIYAAGGPTGDAYQQYLRAEGMTGTVVPIAGNTRESFTVDETGTGEQFRFVLQGPTFDEKEWRACLAAVEEAITPGCYLVGSGSLPPGVPHDFYARIARLATKRDARCIIDTSGEALVAALEEGIFLVKPSGRELAEFTGADLSTDDEHAAAARVLVERGDAEMVALSLGDHGAILASASGVTRLSVPEVVVQSTVGAGDSFLGGFVTRLAQGRGVEDAFRTAVAAGSATVMTPATELCHREDVERLEAELAHPARE